jgi:hypothetical protein
MATVQPRAAQVQQADTFFFGAQYYSGKGTVNGLYAHGTIHYTFLFCLQ